MSETWVVSKPAETVEEFQKRSDAILKAASLIESEGIWLVDDVTRGYMNGLIAAAALLEGKIPEFVGKIPVEQLRILLDVNHPTILGKEPS